MKRLHGNRWGHLGNLFELAAHQHRDGFPFDGDLNAPVHAALGGTFLAGLFRWRNAAA
jgi:hypothetical protein